MAERSDLVLGMKAEQGDVLKMLDKVADAMGRLEKKIDKVGDESVKTAKKTTTAFNKMEKAVKKFGIRVIKVGAAMGVAGFTGVIYKSIKAASAFETKMSEVSTLLGSNAEPKMKKFNKAIRDMAKTTSAAADELASGLYQVISAGTRGTEDAAGAVKLLDSANKMSVAGVGDVRSSVDVLTTALNAWGASADEATQFSDQMFKAIELGKLTLTDLSAGLGTVASAAAGAGIEFGEVNAALAAMTAAGVPPARAMTSLNAIIRVASKGSDKMDAAFKTASSNILREDGLLGVMEALQKVTKGDTIELQKLGIEQEAVTGLAVLAGTGIDKFRSALDKMGNAAGSTDLAYEKMSKTFSFQSKKFYNIINEVFISIGEKLLPILIKKMEEISAWVNDHEEDIKDFFVSVTESIIGFGEFIIEHGGKIATLFAAIWLTSLGPIGMVVAGIGLILAGLHKLTKLMGPGGKGAAMLEGLRAAGIISRPDVRSFADFEYDEDEELGGVSGAEVFGFKKPPKAEKEDKAARDKALAEWLKARVTAIKELQKLELNALGSLTKMRKVHEQEIFDAIAMQGLKEEERERMLALLRQGHRKAESDLIEKAATAREKREEEERKKRLSHWQKITDKAMEQRKVWEDIEEFAAKGIEKWSRKIGGAEGLEEERADVFATAAAARMEKPGFWDKVGTGFAEAVGSRLEGLMMSAADVLMKPFSQIGDLLGMALGGATVGDVRSQAEQMVEFWENFAENIGPVLDYLVEDGIPMILDAFIDNVPDIIDAITKRIPDIIEVFILNVPRIVLAIAEGIVRAVGNLLGIGGGPSVGGAISGAGTGAAIGAGVGSIIPGVGTGVGAALGAGVGLILSLFHEGGFVDKMTSGANLFTSAVKAHSGLFVKSRLSANEVPAILETGEGVIRKEVMSALGGEPFINALNQGALNQGASTDGATHVHLHTEHLYARDAAEVVDDMQSELWRQGKGRMRRVISGGKVSGFRSRRR